MQKRNLLVFAAAFLSSCSCNFTKKQKEEVPTKKIIEIAEFKELKDHDKAIVKFYTDWCGACKMATKPFAEMQSLYPEVKFFAVNMEKKGDLKEKIEIQGFPTFITFENGEERDAILGFNQEKIHQALKNLIQKKEERIAQAEPQILKIKNKQEFEQAIKDNKKVIIKFYGDWCGYCKMIAEDFDELSKEYGDKVKFIEVEVTDNQDLAKEHDIRGVPAFESIENGTKKDSFSGANKDKLQAAVKKLAA